MRYIGILIMPFTFFGCTQDSTNSELLQKQALILNEGMEKQLEYQISFLVAKGAEYPHSISKYSRDARFYYDNTVKLIRKEEHPADSLLVWRLMKSSQARKYNFKPQLDPAIVFGTDTILRKSALLLNLYNYIAAISSQLSICGVDYGLYPKWDKTAKSPSIRLYGDPESSFISALVAESNLSKFKGDTMPLLGTIILTDTVDISTRPFGK